MEAVPIADAPAAPGSSACDGLCLENDIECASCQFRKLSPRWEIELKRLHLRNGRPDTMPIVRSEGGEDFYLTCVCCRVDQKARKKKDKFALGVVTNYSQMQMSYLKRHCDSAHHVEAAKAQGIIVVSPDSVTKHSIIKKAPPIGMMVWAVVTCHTGSSCVDYKQFVAANSVLNSADSADIDAKVGNYSHTKTCSHIVHSTGGVIQDYQHEFADAAIRLAVAADDRDPDRLLRGRFLRVNPVIETADFEMSILRDYGTFPEDAADSVIEGLREFCRERKGP